MKSGIKIGIILCIGCILVSCKPTTIKGKAINPINGKGIKGVAISAQTNTWELPGGAKTKEKVVSDANGNFVLQYKGECQINVSVGADYYPVGWHVNGNTTKGINPERGEATHADYYAVPYGYIQLRVNNVNCHGSTDHFVLYSEGVQYDSDSEGLMLDKTGCYHYNPSGYTKIPAGKRYYRYTVTRDSITNTYRDTVNIEAGEHQVFEIDY